jgi:hypothetical protein
MKRTLPLLASLLFLAILAARAQEGESRFKPGEWDFSPFATYVDKTGDDWGVGAALTYFINQSIGVGATTYWTDFGGTFFDNVEGEAYYRLPLFKRIAPYGVGGVGYQFDSKEWFGSLGGGLDFRAFQKLSAFSDIQYRFVKETRDGVFLRLGLRLSF